MLHSFFGVDLCIDFHGFLVKMASTMVFALVWLPPPPSHRPRPPPPCPPWRVARWKKQFLSNCKGKLGYLLAKERRRRAAAEKKARQHAMKATKLQRRLAKILNEIATVEPVESDPYLEVEMED